MPRTPFTERNRCDGLWGHETVVSHASAPNWPPGAGCGVRGAAARANRPIKRMTIGSTMRPCGPLGFSDQFRQLTPTASSSRQIPACAVNRVEDHRASHSPRAKSGSKGARNLAEVGLTSCINRVASHACDDRCGSPFGKLPSI